ncbi:Aldolase-type TIM barrel [Niveomyces insectorum RCEF 264]|uniref:Aldolase-type TIM barrel n=1 Tax=Niveomyces insectorum RCEF 264 TaxID=1081102 RepID=A0A167YYR6_9HYPO|nr:Aldolase-type TIM barrel [Niveomyces insectorum RCEF 264]
MDDARAPVAAKATSPNNSGSGAHQAQQASSQQPQPHQPSHAHAQQSQSPRTPSGVPAPSPASVPPRHGHDLPFVAPSSYLRPKPGSHSMQDSQALSILDRDQLVGLENIRQFLKIRTSYDVLPLSFRLIVLDTDLLIRKSLAILSQNGIVSAPLWDSHTSTFAGLLTSTDYINLIQYYCQYPDRLSEIDQFRLSGLRDIERAIGVQPPETISVHPMRSLYEACRTMLQTRARRIPLVDVDDETGRQMVVSVVTQYRILKFIAVNNEINTVLLKKPVREIGLGTYDNLKTASMSDPVLDVIHIMVEHNISAVPVVDSQNRVRNVFEAVDVILCIKGGNYDDLQLSVGDALSKRAEDFPGIYTCSEDDRLDAIFDTIRKSRVHRLIVIDDDSRLRGIISLSDILKYVLLFGESDDAVSPDAR